MVLTLDSALAAVRERLSLETDELVLRTFLDATLSDFDRLIRESGVRASDNVIAEIKTAQSCRRAIVEFIEICEDIEDMRTKEEAQDLLRRLEETKVALQGFAVCARVEREYRHLLEALPRLPSGGTDPYGMKLNQKKNQLNRRAPACPACGERMMVASSQENAWWVCSTFPMCFEKQWMTRDDKEYLGFN